MSRCRLLATDLDRTLIPNGEAAESSGARALFARCVAAARPHLAYVTGRRLELVVEAIEDYELPVPDYVLADVGSTLYLRDERTWRESEEWAAWLAEDWPDRRGLELAALFAAEPGLALQEPEAQRPFKLSFYARLALPAEALQARLGALLAVQGLPAVVVYSIDEEKGVGLVDVLPARSTKLRALEYLLKRFVVPRGEALFAGDSGNDLEALRSSIAAVLVANADADLRERVIREAVARGTRGSLHVATGGALGMNGNYAAGILEGWLHFFPEDRGTLLEQSRGMHGERA